MDFTLLLLGFVVLLALANAGISFLPRKAKMGNVVVSFIPPSNASLSPSLSETTPNFNAHISSSNQKIALLFSRVEKMERDIQQLFEQIGVSSTPPSFKENTSSDATWLETIPIRKRRK